MWKNDLGEKRYQFKLSIGIGITLRVLLVSWFFNNMSPYTLVPLMTTRGLRLWGEHIWKLPSLVLVVFCSLSVALHPLCCQSLQCYSSLSVDSTAQWMLAGVTAQRKSLSLVTGSLAALLTGCFSSWGPAGRLSPLWLPHAHVWHSGVFLGNIERSRPRQLCPVNWDIVVLMLCRTVTQTLNMRWKQKARKTTKCGWLPGNRLIN